MVLSGHHSFLITSKKSVMCHYGIAVFMMNDHGRYPTMKLNSAIKYRYTYLCREHTCTKKTLFWGLFYIQVCCNTCL